MKENSSLEKVWPEVFKVFAENCVNFVNGMRSLGVIKCKDPDYTPESLIIVDKAINATWAKDYFKDRKLPERFTLADIGKAPPGSSEAFARVILTLGSYLGEVLAKNLGGTWKRNENMMFGWCVEISVWKVALTYNVFHIAYESLFEPAKLYNTYVAAEVYKNAFEKRGMEALMKREVLESELRTFYDKHIEAIKKVLEPGEKPPGIEIFMYLLKNIVMERKGLG